MRRPHALLLVTCLALTAVPTRALADFPDRRAGRQQVEEVSGPAAERHPAWESVRQRLADGGIVAVLAGVVAMMVVAVLPIPAEIPAAMNGMYFGAGVGILVTWTGAMLGALMSFELARRLGRPLVGRASARVRRAMDRAADALGARGLLVVRLIPVIAFTAINYAAGMAPVTRWTFIWTTGLGILPGTIAMTASGSGMAALYRGNTGLALVLTVGLLAVLVLWKLRRGAQGGVPERSPR